MATGAEWGLGYARQAQADFRMYQELAGKAAVVESHKLQFLQMACEKLVKASLCIAGADPSGLQSSHAYVKRYLPAMLRAEAALVNLPRGESRKVQHRGK